MKQIFIQANREFSGFFGVLKSYYKDPTKFTGKPKMPYYSQKVFQTRFPKEALSFPSKKERKENANSYYVQLSMTEIKVPLPRHIHKKDVLDVVISPKGFGFDIIVNYKINPQSTSENTNENKENTLFSKENTVKNINAVSKIVGCDIGLNNLMAFLPQKLFTN